MIKKVFIGVLSALMLFAFVACDNSPSGMVYSIEATQTGVFVEGEEVSDRIWFSLKESSNADGYSIEPESDSQSILEVTKDGVTVEAAINSYQAF